MFTETEVYKKAIVDYGKEPQKIKAIEEIAELIQAIAKDNRKMITEEMADVTVMLEQLEIIFDNKFEVAGYKQDKIRRLRSRKLKEIDNLAGMIQAITKGNLSIIAQRMADVSILISQLRTKYDNGNEVDEIKKAKIERLFYRLMSHESQQEYLAKDETVMEGISERN